MSVVNVAKTSLPSFGAGNGTVGTTAQQLEAKPVKRHVVIRAHAGNAGTIEISVNATASGFILAAGETSPEIPVDDLSKVWVTGSEAGQDYSYISS